MSTAIRFSHGLLLLTFIVAGCGARASLSIGGGPSGQGGAGAGSSTEMASTLVGPGTTGSTSTGAGCSDAVLGTDADGAGPLVLDGDDVYWATADGRLMKSSGDAPGIQLLDGLNEPASLAVFQDTLYWTETTRVGSIPKAGGAPTILAENQNLPTAIVADAQGIWWMNYGEGITAGSLIGYQNGQAKLLIDLIGQPSDMVADESHLFFAAEMDVLGSQQLLGPLMEVGKSDLGQTVLAQNLHQPAGLFVTSDKLYWLEAVGPQSSFPGRLRSIVKTGGPAVDVGSTGQVEVVRVAVDETDAYVTGLMVLNSKQSGVLERIPLADGKMQIVSQTDGTLYGDVATTSDAVYFTLAWQKGSLPPGSPSVRKLCKSSL